ncbi:hypothetical protein ACFX13_017924 [Malus domestica]
MAIHHLVMGFKPMDNQAEQGGIKSIRIKEIQEGRGTSNDERTIVPLMHSQRELPTMVCPSYTKFMEGMSFTFSSAEGDGSKTKRVLEAAINEVDVGCSPIKKSKYTKEKIRAKERKIRGGERLRGLTKEEHRLNKDKVRDEDEGLLKVPIEYKARWNYIEDTTEASMTKEVRSFSQGGGGGGWPSTAAGEP